MNNATPVPFGVLANAIAALGPIPNNTVNLEFNVPPNSAPGLINYEVKVGQRTCMKISESTPGRVLFEVIESTGTQLEMANISYRQTQPALLTLATNNINNCELRTYFSWGRTKSEYGPSFPHLRLLCLTSDLETCCGGKLLIQTINGTYTRGALLLKEGQ